MPPAVCVGDARAAAAPRRAPRRTGRRGSADVTARDREGAVLPARARARRSTPTAGGRVLVRHGRRGARHRSTRTAAVRAGPSPPLLATRRLPAPVVGSGRARAESAPRAAALRADSDAGRWRSRRPPSPCCPAAVACARPPVPPLPVNRTGAGVGPSFWTRRPRARRFCCCGQRYPSRPLLSA